MLESPSLQGFNRHVDLAPEAWLVVALTVLGEQLDSGLGGLFQPEWFFESTQHN